jgi:hypothetical protein
MSQFPREGMQTLTRAERLHSQVEAVSKLMDDGVQAGWWPVNVQRAVFGVFADIEDEIARELRGSLGVDGDTDANGSEETAAGASAGSFPEALEREHDASEAPAAITNAVAEAVVVGSEPTESRFDVHLDRDWHPVMDEWGALIRDGRCPKCDGENFVMPANQTVIVCAADGTMGIYRIVDIGELCHR